MTFSLWQTLRRGLRTAGGRAAALWLLQALLRRLLPRLGLVCYCCVAQPVPASAPPGKERGQQYAFRLMSRYEPVLQALPRPTPVLQQRFEQGAQCLLATRGQVLAGCIWLARGCYAEDTVQVDYLLPADCAWDFDVYVAPSERLGVLFARQWQVALALLRQSGTRFSLSRIDLLNQASLSAHARLGSITLGWAVFVRLPYRQLMVSSLRPYVAWGGRPQLYLRVAR